MGFLYFPIWVWGSAWLPFGPPELRYKHAYYYHARLNPVMKPMKLPDGEVLDSVSFKKKVKSEINVAKTRVVIKECRQR